MGASYFSKAFLQEAARSVTGLRCPSGKNELILADFHGQWINVQDSRRVTTNQPSTFQNRIYLFGGSCLYEEDEEEVPDELTIASNLQRIVNETMPGRFRVENLGVPAVIAVQEVEVLKSLGLQSGDKVVFYDGANDVTYGVYYLVPAGWRPGLGLPMIRQASQFEKLMIRHFLGWQSRLASLQLLRGRIDLRPPTHLVDSATEKAVLELLARQRTSALLEAHSIVEGSGAGFFSFLQPNIFELPVQTEYRKYVIHNPMLTPPELELAFRRAAPIMRRVVSSLQTAGVMAADLSGVLTPISKSEEVYLDYVHVNHRASQVIAEELFRQVFRRNWRSAAPGNESAVRASLARREADVFAAPQFAAGALADCQLFRMGPTLYAVPKKYGHVWWDGIDVAALPGVVTGETLEQLMIRLRPAPPTARPEPQFLRKLGTYDLFAIGDRIYAVPENEVRWEGGALKMPGVISGSSLQDVVDELPNLSGPNGDPMLLRSVGTYNLVVFRGRVYALPQSLGEVNWEGGQVEKLRGVITGATVKEVLARLPEHSR